MPRYRSPQLPYVTPPELRGEAARRHKVAIVGAGPVGLACAVDLALHGVPSVLLDDNDVVSVGSRAICWAKRTLEIFDRLGVGERMLEKGVTWKVGRLFHRDREVYAFDLLPEPGHKMPAFVNLQQYHVEEYLLDRCRDFPDLIELRFRNRVTEIASGSDGVHLTSETPDGIYGLEADYLLACDGARSTIRQAMGLEFEGAAFEERFLIADIEMKADFPSERWFWFEPPFHEGQSALLHKQPDDIYRIDLQLGWDADPEEEAKPERVRARIERIVEGRRFTLDWVSIYSFQCRRLRRFVHDRVVFVGDSAHVVSPFGARGGNGGIQDADNLCWKLAAVIEGAAPPALLESYDAERVHGADENIRHSARATRFMSPKDGPERLYRDAVLALAADHPFARRLVNSGRLSTPCALEDFPGTTPDPPDLPAAIAEAPMGHGRPCLDAPVEDADGRRGWLLERLGGDFALLSFGMPVEGIGHLRQICVSDRRLAGVETVRDVEGRVASRYGGAPGAAYLIRPDQHVAARWSAPNAALVARAHARALGGEAREKAA